MSKRLLVASCVVLATPFALLAAGSLILGVAGLRVNETVIGVMFLVLALFGAHGVFDVVRWHIREAGR